jgi:hypothetical protein
MIFFKNKSKQSLAYVQTEDGNITLVLNGATHCVGKDHPNYQAILDVLASGVQEGLDRLLNIKREAANIEGVHVDERGFVTFQGEQIRGVIADKIARFVREGRDYGPLALFLSNLMQNPSGRAVNELYQFLEHKGMALTEDGCFVAYKGVRSDFKDKHSGTFDNSVGQTVSIPRNQVNDDCTQTCSYGLHVGTHEYATGWAGSDGRVVLVKVNPADAVSVPREVGAAKLRVCSYVVLEECEALVASTVYTGSSGSWEPDDDEEEYICEDCGNPEVDCDCDEDGW